MGPARHAKHPGASGEVKDLSHQWSIYGFHLLSIQYPSYGDGTNLPGGVPKTLPKPISQNIGTVTLHYGVCFSTVPRSIVLNSGTFRENSSLAGGLRQEGCQFRVASSHQPGAASSQGKPGGERNTSWHPALIESVSPVAALPVDRMVESETFPICSRHAGCSATGIHQRLRLPSFPRPLTPALLLSQTGGHL